MGAEYLFYMTSIETHARAFLALIISGIGTVRTIRRNTVSLFLLKNITEQNNFLNIFYFGDFFKICT